MNDAQKIAAETEMRLCLTKAESLVYEMLELVERAVELSTSENVECDLSELAFEAQLLRGSFNYVLLHTVPHK